MSALCSTVKQKQAIWQASDVAKRLKYVPNDGTQTNTEKAAALLREKRNWWLYNFKEEMPILCARNCVFMERCFCSRKLETAGAGDPTQPPPHKCPQ